MQNKKTGRRRKASFNTYSIPQPSKRPKNIKISEIQKRLILMEQTFKYQEIVHVQKQKKLNLKIEEQNKEIQTLRQQYKQLDNHRITLNVHYLQLQTHNNALIQQNDIQSRYLQIRDRALSDDINDIKHNRREKDNLFKKFEIDLKDYLNQTIDLKKQIKNIYNN